MIRVNELVESKEFRDFIDSIPFDTTKEYVLLSHCKVSNFTESVMLKFDG